VIIDLPSTNSSKINRALVDLREKGGSITLGRVLTLVIITDDSSAEDPIAAANAASFEHPCRVIVVARGARRASPRMDAQIRVGGDAGASEVVVLRLYGTLVDHGASVVVPLLLADAPVVAWWPGDAPEVPADDPIGALAQRRITDAAAAKRPGAQLTKRIASYRPGDTDLSWTRITRWRGLLAATMDQPPYDKVTSASVAGAADSPSADLLAAWLAVALKCPVKRIKSPAKSGPGLHSVILSRRAGDISMLRPQTITAELRVGNQPARHVALPRRGLRDCLAEELRRLDADDVYAEVLSRGLALVAKQAEAGTAPTKGTAIKSATTKATPTKVTATNGKPQARRTRAARGPAPATVAGEAASAVVASTSSNGDATMAALPTEPAAVGATPDTTQDTTPDATPGTTPAQSPAASSGASESGRTPRRRRSPRTSSTS
jgi:glucose-6-phosphate dehydrogenase assembly protein OpcA